MILCHDFQPKDYDTKNIKNLQFMKIIQYRKLIEIVIQNFI